MTDHEIEPRVATLQNGLCTVVIEVPGRHTVSVVVYARVGSRYETPATNGLSHFVEHMLFRGTKSHPGSLALHREIESFGGTLYAETGRDYSLYQIVVHPESLGPALATLSEIFREPTFQEIGRERAIVLEEILEDLDEEGRNVNVADVARKAAFAGHPLGLTIPGPPGNVRRFTRADVRRHFLGHYGAANMVLCLSGAVSARTGLSLARRHFGGLRRGRAVRPAAAPAHGSGPRIVHVENRGSQSDVQIIFSGLPERHPDFTTLQALLRILDDGMSTRLHYHVCDRLGLAYSCGAQLEPLCDTSLLEIDATSSHAKLPDLVGAILRIVADLRDRPCVPEELAKAKRRFLWDLEAAFDDPDALAGWFAGIRLFYEPEGLARRAARMERVTLDDVLRVARAVLAPERLTIAIVGHLVPGARRRIDEAIRAFGAGAAAASPSPGRARRARAGGAGRR